MALECGASDSEFHAFPPSNTAVLGLHLVPALPQPQKLPHLQIPHFLPSSRSQPHLPAALAGHLVPNLSIVQLPLDTPR